MKHWQKIEGQVKNTGGVELRKILVRASGGIESDGPYPVGDLQPGNSRAFAIGVYPRQLGASVPLKIEVEFLDVSSKFQIITKSFDMEVHDLQPQNLQPTSVRTGPVASSKYNTKNIRALLCKVFSDTELHRMCLDIEALRPIHDSLTRGMRKDEIVDLIINHSMRKGGCDFIIDLAKQENPDAWNEYKPYFAYGAGKRTILFLAADPQDSGRLNLLKEMREIKKALEQAPLRDKFALHSELAVCSAGITKELLGIRPSIMHFSGHGSRSGAICIENQYGKTHPVEAETLSFLLQLDLLAKNLECVVLNACYSEIQARVIAQHAKYVVGMRSAIGDDSAIDFSIGFYQALGAGSEIVDAFKTGVALMRLNESNVALGHIIPKLYVDGLLSIQE
ncbi:MAG: CHAT domain-containing protein [Blastocatellia bacterium]